MESHLTLCDECLARYRALRPRVWARRTMCLVPFGSPVWTDEHPGPDAAIWGSSEHRRCLASISRLVTARNHLWRAGAVREDQQGLWDEALQVLPHWPGFRRLEPSRGRLAALAACEAETRAMFRWLAAGVEQVRITDEGDGLVSFQVDQPALPADAPPIRRWWERWRR